MNAPTKKVQNMIDDGMQVWVHNTLCVASHIDGEAYEDYDPKTGDSTIEYEPPCYHISYHNGLTPAFNTETFATLQELANAMRKIADLRTWTAQEIDS